MAFVTVSGSRGVVFLHPMKTATTSVANYIRAAIQIHQPGREEHHFEGHETPQELMWRLDIEEDWFEQRYCVLFVRNPYDRLVSFYHHMRQIGGHARGLCLRKTFQEFVCSESLTRIMRPQSDYLECNGRRVIDFIGKYEALKDDVYRLIDEIGFSNAPEIKEAWLTSKVFQSTNHGHYESYYTPGLKALVYETYSDDFAAFGYEGGS